MTSLKTFFVVVILSLTALVRPQISSANQSNRLAENSGNQPIESFLVPNAIAIQCSFCPLDASIVCVTGTGVEFLELSETRFYILLTRPSPVFSR